MTERAKIFTTGGSQAVRLPKAFRFETGEVFIRRNAQTCEVVLSEKPTSSWLSFYEIVAQTDVPDEFMADRKDLPPERGSIF